MGFEESLESDLARSNASSSQDDQSLTSSPRDRSKEFQLSHVEEILERSSQKILNDYELRYGFYDEDSALHEYVDQLAKETLGSYYSKVQIYIAKNTPHCEAFALPNGAIVISPKMIEVAKYRESLQALIAHEAFHVIDEHSRKNLIQHVNKNRSINSKLELIGVKRAQEHMADLYQHLLATQNDDINPMGSVVLLENIDEFFKKSRAGLVHGHTTDRALITEGIFYFYPFKNLSKELNEIPKDIMGSIEDFNPIERIDICGKFAKKEAKQAHYKAKKRILANVADEDLSFYIAELIEVASSEKRNSKLIEPPLERFSDTYFSDEWDDDEPWVVAMDSALKLIAPDIYTEESLENSETLNWIYEYREEEYSNLENFFKIETILNDEKFLKIFSKHKVSADKLLNFFKETLSEFIERHEGDLSEGELARIDKLVCSLADAGEQFSISSSTYPMQAETIKMHLYDYLVRKSKNTQLDKYFDKFKRQTDLKEINIDDLDTDSEVYKLSKYLDGELDDLAIVIRDVILDDESKESKEKIDQLKINTINSFSSAFSKTFGNLTSPEEIYDIYSQTAQIVFSYDRGNIGVDYFYSIIIFSVIDAINKHSLNEDQKNNLILNIINDDHVIHHTHQDSDQRNDIDAIIEKLNFKTDQAKEKIKKILEITILGRIDEFLVRDLNREEVLLTISPLPNLVKITTFYTDSVSGEHYACKILAKYLSKFDTIDELMREIEALEESGFRAWEMISNEYNVEQFSYVAYPFIKNLETNGLDTADIEHYRKLTNFLKDNLTKKSFLNLLNKKELETKSYEERIDLIFDRIKRKLAGFKELKAITDDEVCTHDDFKKLKESFKNNISCLHDFNTVDFGKLAIGSLITTGSLGASLRTAEATIGRAANESIRKLIVEDDPFIKESLLSEDSLLLNEATTSRLNSVESAIFSIDSRFRRALLLRILSGKNGLISNKGEYRRKFLKFLLNDILNENNDNTLKALLEDIVNSSGEIETWKPLFFSLQNLLVDYTLKPNQDVSDWYSFIEDERLGYPADEMVKITGETIRRSKLNSEERKGEKYEILDDVLADSSVLNWRQKYKFTEGINLRILDFLENENYIEERSEFVELEVLDLILEICQSAGALGVRFLQLFPLFTNLKPEYKDKFSKAFDKVDGQSRFVAIMTLDDNWDHFWDDVEYVYPGKIGGGSINTVLKLKMKENAYHPEFSGKTITVKVRNPNLEFHLEETFNMLSETIDGMIKINPKYKIAKLIIDDVYLWIKNELSYENYVEKDKQFHAELSEFNETNNGVQIITPETYRVPLKEGIEDTNLIIAEDFIESDQITDGFSNLKEKGYEMKSVVATMIRNYCFQLSKGFANSDISIGNYLMAKGEDDETLIAIIDKLYFLEIDDEIKDSLKPLITLLQILGEDPKEYAKKIRANVNLDIDDSQIKEIEQKLTSLKEDFSKNDFSIEKAKETFTDIVKLVPELDQLLKKLSTQDVILEDSKDFVSEVFRIFKQEIESSELDSLASELNDARTLLIEQARADGVLDFANKIIEKLDLNSETKELIDMLIAMYAFSVKSSDEKASTINKLVTNKGFAIKSETKDQVKAVLTEAKAQFENNEFGEAINIFHKLREIGLVFDIRITLALKNIFAFHQMAIDAGFENGFFECLCYREEK